MRTPAQVGVRLAATVALVSLLASGPPAHAADPLDEITFAVGDEELFGAPSAGGGEGWKGTWSFEHGRMLDGRLDLHFEIDPWPETLPVRSGPAVLFAALHLSGTPGGDVGMDVPIPSIVHEVIPACENDAACRYSVDIELPIDPIPAAIARLEEDGELVLVGVGLTLVRTYGDGQWLQVLLFSHGFEGMSDSIAGRLGAMEPANGRLFWSGLFPADQARRIPKGFWGLPESFDYAALVERLRVKAGDTSEAIPMVDVALDVLFEPACPYDMELVLHDADRNHLFHAYTDHREPAIRATTHMPPRRPWYLTLHGGYGIDGPYNVRLGPIEADASPIEVHASLDCDASTGSLNLIGAVTPTVTPTLPPAVPSPTPFTAIPSAAVHVSPAPGAPSPDPASTSTDPAPLVAGLALVALGMIGLAFFRGPSRRPTP